MNLHSAIPSSTSMRTIYNLAALVSFLTPGAHALYETTYHSTSLAIQPLTILQKSSSYDPDNTTLFLVCPVGTIVDQPGPTIYMSTGDLVWSNPSLGGCEDFNIQTFNGQQYLTMWLGSGSAVVGAQEGSGNATMLNSNYEIVMNVSAVNPGGTDLHEFNIVKPANQTALVTAFNTIPVRFHCAGGPQRLSSKKIPRAARLDVRWWPSERVLREFDRPGDRYRHEARPLQLDLSGSHRSFRVVQQHIANG